MFSIVLKIAMNFLFALCYVSFSLEDYDELPTCFSSFFGVLESNLEYQTQRNVLQMCAELRAIT